jgi:hypothetical protein
MDLLDSVCYFKPMSPQKARDNRSTSWISGESSKLATKKLGLVKFVGETLCAEVCVHFKHIIRSALSQPDEIESVWQSDRIEYF